jgi:hypothetical protein
MTPAQVRGLEKVRAVYPTAAFLIERADPQLARAEYDRGANQLRWRCR